MPHYCKQTTPASAAATSGLGQVAGKKVAVTRRPGSAAHVASSHGGGDVGRGAVRVGDAQQGLLFKSASPGVPRSAQAKHASTGRMLSADHSWRNAQWGADSGDLDVLGSEYMATAGVAPHAGSTLRRSAEHGSSAIAMSNALDLRPATAAAAPMPMEHGVCGGGGGGGSLARTGSGAAGRFSSVRERNGNGLGADFIKQTNLGDLSASLFMPNSSTPSRAPSAKMPLAPPLPPLDVGGSGGDEQLAGARSSSGSGGVHVGALCVDTPGPLGSPQGGMVGSPRGLPSAWSAVHAQSHMGPGVLLHSPGQPPSAGLRASPHAESPFGAVQQTNAALHLPGRPPSSGAHAHPAVCLSPTRQPPAGLPLSRNTSAGLPSSRQGSAGLRPPTREGSGPSATRTYDAQHAQHAQLPHEFFPQGVDSWEDAHATMSSGPRVVQSARPITRGGMGQLDASVWERSINAQVGAWKHGGSTRALHRVNEDAAARQWGSAKVPT